jgi:hypothetical protein
MCGAILPLPQYVFMVWCLVKHRDNFTFTFRGVRVVGNDANSIGCGGVFEYYLGKNDAGFQAEKVTLHKNKIANRC